MISFIFGSCLRYTKYQKVAGIVEITYRRPSEVMAVNVWVYLLTETFNLRRCTSGMGRYLSLSHCLY